MADDGWVDYVEPRQPAAPSGGGWVDYTPPEPPRQAAQSQGGWVDYDPEEERRRRLERTGLEPPPPSSTAEPRQPTERTGLYRAEPPEGESGILGSFGRAFAHDAPGVAAGAAGAMAGAGAGAISPIPGGAIIGGLAGGFAGGMAGGAGADEALKLLGADDSVQRAIDEKAHPWATAAGHFAAQAIGFGVAPASTATRLIGAGLGGAIEAGQQVYRGEFDPLRLGTQAAAGAVFTKPYQWGERLEQAGARAGEQIATGYRSRAAEKFVGPTQPYGPPEMQGPRAPEYYGPPEMQGPRQPGEAVGSNDTHPSGRAGGDAAGTAQPAIPPPDLPPPNPHNAPTEAQTQGYMKPDRPQVPAGEGGVTVIDPQRGNFDPTVRSVLEAENPAQAAELRQNVLERGRSGRPIRTGELPIGTEEQILEQGARRAEEGPRPGEVPPPDMQAMARKVAPPMTREQLEAMTAGVPVNKVAPTSRAIGRGALTPEAMAAAEGASPASGTAKPLTPDEFNARLEGTVGAVPVGGRKQQLAEKYGPGSYLAKTEPEGTPAVPPKAAEAIATGKAADADVAARIAANDAKIAELEARIKAKSQGAVPPEKNLPAATPVDKTGTDWIQKDLDARVAAVKGEAPAVPPEPMTPPKVTPPEEVARMAETVRRAQEMGSREAPPPAGGPPREPPGGPPGGPPVEPPAPSPRGPERPRFLDEVVQRPKRLLEEMQNIFAPHLRSEAAGSLRQRAIKESGITQSVADKAENMMARHDPTIDAMSPERKQAFKDWFEAGKPEGGPFNPSQAEKSAGTALTVTGSMWENQLRRLNRTEGMDFIKDYLPHMYKNPEAAAQFIDNYAANMKGGGAGSLRKRFFDAEAAARAAGHEPLFDNPFDAFRHYGESMKKFVAKEALREHVVDSGIGMYAQPPKVVGAAGAPEPAVQTRVPPGWVPSQTAPVKNGQQLYLPEDVVRIFDRFNGERGLAEKYPGLYGAAKTFNTGWNKVLLAISGYHLATMGNEGMINGLLRAGQLGAQGKWGEAGQTAAGAWKSPVTTPKLGSKIQEAYLNLDTPAAAIRSGLDSDVITGMSNAGFRFVGSKHTPELNMGGKGSYIKAKGEWMKTINSIPEQMAQGLKDTKSEWLDAKGNVPEMTKFAFKQIGRLIETSGEALFNVYIPKLKTGAAYLEVKQWKDANPGISIHSEEGMRAVNKIISNIDDRFGEMATDRTFINKSVQDAATAGMTSYSWVLGSLKGIGGGANAIVGKPALALAKGDVAGAKEALGRFKVTSGANYDPRMSSTVAMGVQMALMSAAYQMVFGAHEAPKDWRDLYAPRTGGTIPGFGGKGTIPEHMLVPGFQKDVYGYVAHPVQEAYGKVGGGWKTLIEQTENADWRGQPIVRPHATAMEALSDRLSHVMKQFGPLSIKNWTEGGPEGSAIPAPFRAAGFRATSKEFSDPEKAQMLRDKREMKAWKYKVKTENREARERGRPEPYQ